MDINSTVRLSNGVKIPMFGFGTYQIHSGKETEYAVTVALKAGYRHIDTAAYYMNEASVGAAIRASGIPRDQIFVTTKLKNPDHDNPRAAFERSLKELGLRHIDLYLIHWPVEGKRLATWKVFEELYASKLVRAIGVSNYTIRHLQELLSTCRVKPMVNQVEFHPYLCQQELHEFCKGEGIALEAYSPLVRAEKMQEPTLARIAVKYKKTPAQILIRWSLQHSIIVIPKSRTQERIEQNANVFDFKISTTDMHTLDSLNENFHTCWDPTNAP